jgi:hypothetical protein
MMIFPSLYLKNRPSNAPKKFRNKFFDMFLSPKNQKLDSAILGDNIWLLLGDGILPVRFQEQVVPVALFVGLWSHLASATVPLQACL